MKIRSAGLVVIALLVMIFATGNLDAKTRNLDSIDQVEKIRLIGANNVPVKLIVVFVPEKNKDFVISLVKLVIDMHKEDRLTAQNPFKVHIVPSSTALKNDFADLKQAFKPDELAKFVEFNKDHVSNDIWMQDWGEVATVKVKNQTKPQLLILDSNRGRGNSKLPELLSKFWNCYYLKNPSNANSFGDYGGNIEVTPDDVLVIGNTSTDALRNFLVEHGYKNRMAIIETDWLRVGHCDEYISIAPNPKARTGYSLIKANPRLALRLIKKASRKELEDIPERDYARMLLDVHDYLVKHEKDNFNFSMRNEGIRGVDAPYPLVTAINSIDDQGNMPKMRLSIGRTSNDNSLAEKEVEDFIKLNLSLATLIDSNVKNVTDKISEVRKEQGKYHSVLSFPVLYHKIRGKHIAYVPGCVNQLILNRHLIIPDPLIESFKLNIARTASRVGLKANFLNDMVYHILEGEIHCGTNVFRHPNKYIVRPK